MNSIGHEQFIMTPISNIIGDTNRACICIGDGMESYPLASYIVQTTLLRLTGASEQKLKCICWEFASFDYEFRYEMLKNPLGECSSYDNKKNIFKSICKSLVKYDICLDLLKEERKKILNASTSELESMLDESLLAIWFPKEMNVFRNINAKGTLKGTMFCNIGENNIPSFLEKALKEYYENYVYRYRNRYAHNLTSYQMNVPTLTQLSNMDREKNNHFRMFSTLILLDGIFMKYFEKLQTVKLSHSY